MPVTRPARIATGVALTGLVLAGCAEAVQATPAARVDAAFSSVLDTDRLTVTAELDLDDANRTAIAALATQDGTLSATAVERILGTRLVATTVATEGELSDLTLSYAAGAVPGVSSSVALEVAGDALVELRQVGTTVYARADLSALEAAYEIDGMTDDLTAGLEEGPAELAGALDSLVAGDWVSVDTAELTAQLEELGLTAPVPTATQDSARATAALEDFFSEAAAVLRKEVGVTETGADEYEVTAPLDTVITSLTPSLTTLVGELVTTTGALPTVEGEDPDELLHGVTEGVRTATVEVGLDGDRLATARFDVVQLADEDTRAKMAADDVTALPVLLSFAHEGDVADPEGVTAVDLAGLLAGAGERGEGLMYGFPLGEVLEPGYTDEALYGNDVDGSETWEMTAEEAAELGMTAEAMGLTDEDFAAYLVELGVVITP